MLTARRRVLAAGVLTIAAVVWLLVNHPIEGRVLLVLTPDRGVTEADLPAFALLALAALLLLTLRR